MMDFEQSPGCQNCLKLYALKDDRHLPLLLVCGHSFCSSCLSVMGRTQKHSWHIKCPECNVPTKFSPERDILEQLPPNLYLLGLMLARQLGLRRVPSTSPVMTSALQGGYRQLSIPSPAQEKPAVEEPCEECGVCPATAKCLQCVGLYCETCFKVVHAASKSMRRHSRVPASEALRHPTACHTHPTEPLKHFCQEDHVPVCLDCTISGGHKGHPVVSLVDAADGYRDNLRPIISSAGVTLRHMKDMEKSVSEQLPVLSQQSLVQSRELQTSFVNIHSLLQRRELSLLEELAEATDTCANPLLKMRDTLRTQIQSVTATISRAQTVLGDNLELARTAEQLIVELAEVDSCPQMLETNHSVPIKFSLDASLRQLLQGVGSITYAREGEPPPTSIREHPVLHPPTLVLSKPLVSPSPRSISPCSPPRRQIRTSSRSPSVPFDARGASPRIGGRHSASVSPKVDGRKEGRSTSVSPTPSIEETREVYVTHVETPGEFYVQFVEKDPEVKRIMDQVNAHCRTPHPLKKIAVGLPCAAQFSEDDVWYRAVVEEFHPPPLPYATVFYTDFGNSENVSPDRISSLPSSLTAEPPLCHHCMLAYLSPPGRNENVAPLAWTTRANSHIKSLIKANSNTPLRVKVYEEDASGLHVDLFLPSTSADLLSVSKKLVTMGLAARARGGKKDAPRIPSPAIPALGEEVQVVVSTAYSPHDFYVQMVSCEHELDSLATQLEQEMAKARTPAGGLMPQKGMACCAKFSEDGQWYRAKVTGVTGEGVQVLYLDYGNHETVPVGALEVLPPSLMTQPTQAVHCRLHEVETTDLSGMWSEQACDNFHDIVSGLVFSMRVCGKGSPLPVTLTDTRTSQPVASILVVQRLARNKFATELSSQSSRSSQGSKKLRKKKQHTATPAKHVIPQIQKQSATPPLTPPAKREIPPQHRGLPLSQLPRIGDTVPCKVVQVTAPNNFHVHFSEAEESLRALLTQVVELTFSGNVRTGDYCLAHFKGDCQWYRTKVEEELGGGYLRVSYVDYGNTDVVSSLDVAALPESFMSVPALGVLCSLEGVEPVGGAGVWPDESSFFFSTLVIEKASAITVKGLPADNQAPLLVQLLTQNPEGVVDVGSLLVSTHHATFHPHRLPKPSKADPSDESLSSSTSSSFLPPKPPKSDHFVMMVTYVDSEGIIHGHLQQEDLQVIQLAEKLQLLCDGQRRVQQVASLTPGQPCLARYRGDGAGRWYRALVERCNPADNTATVLYVDFGNRDTVKTSKLVDVAPLLEVPIQAFAVRLANMEGEEWRVDQVSALADLVTGQTLEGIVVEPGSTYPLVQLTRRGEDVSSLLVTPDSLPDHPNDTDPPSNAPDHPIDTDPPSNAPDHPNDTDPPSNAPDHPNDTDPPSNAPDPSSSEQLGFNGCDSSVVDRPGNPRNLNSDILTLEVPSRDQALPAPGVSGDTSGNVTAASSTLDLHSDVHTPDLPSSDKPLPAPGESSDTSDKVTAHSNIDFHTPDLPSGDKTLPAPGESSDTSDKVTAHSNIDFHTPDLPSGDKPLPAPVESGDKEHPI